MQRVSWRDWPVALTISLRYSSNKHLIVHVVTETFKLNKLGSDRDQNGAYLIDRSPILFEHVLNYLRTNKLIYETQQQLQAILLEAEFYNLQVEVD